MAQNVYVVDPPNPLGIVFIPIIAPPGYLVYLTWQLLPANLHPMFKLIVAILEIAAMIYAVYLFFKHTPMLLAASAAALYVGAVYGYLLRRFYTGHDLVVGSHCRDRSHRLSAGALGFAKGEAK